MTEDGDNNIVAAGGVFAALTSVGGLDPQMVTVDDQATNAMTVKPDFMKSRYRLTVERVRDEDGSPARETAES